MSNVACEQCADLAEPFVIASPGQLSRSIGQLQALVQAGLLSDVTPSYSPFSAFASLSSSAPWPDYVENHLRCTRCKRTFMLAVDTYHGGPGRWHVM